MHTPYTTNFGDAYETAHLSIAAMTSAVLWHRRDQPLVPRALLQIAILLVAIAPRFADFAGGLGMHLSLTYYESLLRLAALVGTLATLCLLRPLPILVAIAGEVALYFIVDVVKGSAPELASAHLAWLGLLTGFQISAVSSRAAVPDAVRARDSTRGDWVLFIIATILGGLVADVVLQKQIGSSDEWAYTFQSAVFAKFHAYSTSPGCDPSFQNFWIFPYMGKLFSQYTPGWPYFMVPFVWLHVPWLAGSFAFGILVVGVARLARFAMSLSPNATAASIRAAGLGAAVTTLLSSTFLINAGSRFPHIFVLACFVWATLALLHLGQRERDPHAQGWCNVLGVACPLLLATRPVDGAGLGVGLFLYFTYALVRGRVSLRMIAAVAIPFTLLSILTLVILRLQLGKWFTTAYSLAPMIHPWAKYALITPKPDEWRWGLPIATGSYGWFPAALALGFAGLASLGRRALHLVAIFIFSIAPVIIFYAYLDLARGSDWGYGPRYQMVLTVPMIIGGGVIVGQLVRNRSHAALGALAAIVVIAVVRLAPLVYPFNYTMVQNENRVTRAIELANAHHALVIASPGTGAVDPHDLTQNLPLDLYPDQDVIIAVPRTPSNEQCVRQTLPGRTVYRASGSQNVTLTRER